ncbi:MAG: 2-hydroxychromene-2-carboxylate isomerase [Hyphomicrobiales bacterium]|nr:2-hydroxychromene-2-carboxylate isomerase [Hyphomicrobiales bacterium]
MKSLEFLFDFGSPNAYLAHKVLPGIAARTGATITYVPILLGGIFKLTNNRSPAESMAGIRNRLDYEWLETERFVRKHQLPFARNPFFPVNTLMLMRGAVAAQELGVFPAYVDAMFDAMWAEPKKMDDPAVVGATLAAAGLPAAALFEAAQSQPVKDKLLANTTAAVERGAFGAPTFFVGPEIYFGKDRLAAVEEALAS